mgnify:CR=1 FL=1
MDTVIEIRGLTKAFGQKVAVDRINLDIPSGSFYGLVGRNGAGKTTTMRILAGETEPYGGSVTRSGEIGYLPQDPRTGDLTVTARQRILSARGLDRIVTDRRTAEQRMSSADPETLERAMARFARASISAFGALRQRDETA